MTAPGGSAGTAYISFHARTDRLQPELEAALRDATEDADDFLDRAGTQWGETLSDSASDEIRRHGRDFADSMEHALAGQVISLRGTQFRVDRRGFLHDLDTGQFAGRIVDNIIDGLNRAATPGGPFSKVGTGIADAIGAGFNVSGRSPLIMVLVFAIGAIAAAIAGLLQMVNALLAVMTTIPALIGAIGLQVGVLMLAFEGVGTAISGAFAAKNWNDFYAAIQGLTPAAQNFIVTLLPLRDLIRDLKTSVQESFFAGFGNTMVNVIQQLGPILRTGLPQLATALGVMFKNIGLFFASPTFVTFVNEIIPATIRWLGQFGPGFTSFLTALINMATKSIPFLERVGQIVGQAFGMFTSWLNDQVNSGAFTDWLVRMAETLEKMVPLFINATDFVISFLDALDRSGGNDIIDQFSELFAQLAMFFGSEAGQAAMAGFIHLVQILTYSFSGLIFAVMGLLIAFESILQFFGFVGFAFMKFVEAAGEAKTWLDNFLNVELPLWLTNQTLKVLEFFAFLGGIFVEGWNSIVDGARDIWNGFTEWLSGVVESIVNFFTGLPDRLLQIGRDLMNGLWNGIKSGWEQTVAPLLNSITNAIPDWKGPESKDKALLKPAGRAIMHGFGEGLMQGADQVRGMLNDFTGSLTGEAGGSVFNTNLNFYGQPPTESQARTAGRAAAEEMNKQVTSTNIRLAYRMA